jgi:hypothetical protein
LSTFRILGELFGGSRKPERSPRNSNGNGHRYGSVEIVRTPILTTLPLDQRLKMLDQVVSHYVESYKENARIIGAMDEKAQRTGAFGGIFIASVLAFFARARGYEVLGTVGYSGLTILSIAVVFFLVSAMAGILVMWVRFIEGMVSPSTLGRITEDLLDATLEPGSMQVSLENWYRTQSTTWAGIIASQAKAMMRKSRWLMRAQRLMMAGLVFATGFTLIAVTGTNLDLLQGWIRGVLPR